MAISCSGFNTTALFFHRIFKIDNALVNASLIFFILFCGEDLFSQFSHGRLPNIWLVGEHSDPNGTMCMQAFGPLKKATRPCRQFLIAPAPISSLFLCPHMPLFTLHAQPKPWCHAGSIFHLFFWERDWLFAYVCLYTQVIKIRQ